MVTALSNSENIDLIMIASVFIATLAIPWLGYHVYERFYNNILEASFILNICLLSIATYHVKAVDHNQTIVTYLSISCKIAASEEETTSFKL